MIKLKGYLFSSLKAEIVTSCPMPNRRLNDTKQAGTLDSSRVAILEPPLRECLGLRLKCVDRVVSAEALACEASERRLSSSISKNMDRKGVERCVKCWEMAPA